ncbi:DUF4235 domain-containing protein [Thermopolyspora sp. NPDC052614]|uniref:DUF4235 domain-containing protein n=1 Tax=Thermopolyspora sp. NPDC052614 TaxID=3155682 RepID=UPI003432AC4D
MNLLYKGLSLLVSLVGGMLAVKLFNRVWTKAVGEEHAPADARDPERNWRDVLLAAAAQGAVYGLVKAATRRAAVQSVRKDLRRFPERRIREAREDRVLAGHRRR